MRHNEAREETDRATPRTLTTSPVYRRRGDVKTAGVKRRPDVWSGGGHKANVNTLHRLLLLRQQRQERQGRQAGSGAVWLITGYYLVHNDSGYPCTHDNREQKNDNTRVTKTDKTTGAPDKQLSVILT